MKNTIHVSSAPQKAPYLLGTVIDSPTGPSVVLDESGSKGALDVGILSCYSGADDAADREKELFNSTFYRCRKHILVC